MLRCRPLIVRVTGLIKPSRCLARVFSRRAGGLFEFGEGLLFLNLCSRGGRPRQERSGLQGIGPADME